MSSRSDRGLSATSEQGFLHDTAIERRVDGDDRAGGFLPGPGPGNGDRQVQKPGRRKNRGDRATDCQAMDHLDVLCNRIGPRLTGSDNLTLNWETPAEQPKSKP